MYPNRVRAAQGNLAEFAWFNLVALTPAAVCIHHSHQFVAHECRVLQVLLPCVPFDESQVDAVFRQCFFNLGRIATEQVECDLRKAFGKMCQEWRQHVLGYGSAGSKAQFATVNIAQQTHFVFQTAITFKDALAVFPKHPTRFSQDDRVAFAFEQACLVGRLQFLDVLCHRRLTDKQFLRCFCETQILCYTGKYFQSEISHVRCGFFDCVILAEIITVLVLLRSQVIKLMFRFTQPQAIAN